MISNVYMYFVHVLQDYNTPIKLSKYGMQPCSFEMWPVGKFRGSTHKQ